MFSASDPFYMLMLLQNLGKQYVVWDKSANIRFRKPGRQTLYARFVLTPDQIDTIREAVATNGQTEQVFTLQWVDKDQVVHAEIERLCYIADKAHYEARKKDSQQSRFRR